MMVLNRPCPLCGSRTESNPINMGHQRHYLCKSCGEFVIDTAGESHVAGLPVGMRNDLSGEARKTSGEYVYVITITQEKDSTDVQGQAVLRREVLR